MIPARPRRARPFPERSRLSSWAFGLLLGLGPAPRWRAARSRPGMLPAPSLFSKYSTGGAGGVKPPARDPC